MPPKSQSKSKARFVSKQSQQRPQIKQPPSEPPQEAPNSILRHPPRPPTLSRIHTVYLVYILLCTTHSSPPKLIIRKIYDSQVEALQAFKREYGIWTTNLFPARHSEDQLTGSYTVNLMEMSRTKKDQQSPGYIEVEAKVEYAIVHRADVNLEDDNPRKRVCVVGCKEMERVAS